MGRARHATSVSSPQCLPSGGRCADGGMRGRRRESRAAALPTRVVVGGGLPLRQEPPATDGSFCVRLALSPYAAFDRLRQA